MVALSVSSKESLKYKLQKCSQSLNSILGNLNLNVQENHITFFMIVIIMASYLKHMDVVISSSCTALPLGHSLFS